MPPEIVRVLPVAVLKLVFEPMATGPDQTFVPAVLNRLPLLATPGPKSLSELAIRLAAPRLLSCSCELMPTVTTLPLTAPPAVKTLVAMEPGPAVTAPVIEPRLVPARAPPNVTVKVLVVAVEVCET